MLKLQATSVLLLGSRAYYSSASAPNPSPSPSRLSLDDNSRNRNPNPNNPKHPVRYRTKTTMAADSESQVAPEQPGPPVGTRRSAIGPLFPMGYKDAAYQWVGFPRLERAIYCWPEIRSPTKTNLPLHVTVE